jgi:hypothetical protein
MAARSRSGAATKTVVALVVVAAAVLAVGLGVRTLWHRVTTDSSPRCQFGDERLRTDQAAVASSMVGVVIRRNLPEQAAVLTIAAALQESKLVNVPAGAGDRDSVGVLQQRPSQGWGTAAQLSDVRFATGKFLDALVKVPHWQTDDLATVIQAVQISADGSAYAQHESAARAIVTGLWGAARGVSCRFAKPTAVAPAKTVATQLVRDLPVNTPVVNANTVRVDGASWRTVAWLVTNADRLGIASVRFADSEWSRTKGWHDHEALTHGRVEATMAG